MLTICISFANLRIPSGKSNSLLYFHPIIFGMSHLKVILSSKKALETSGFIRPGSEIRE